MWTVHLLVWRTGVSRNRYGFYGSVCRVSISKVTFPIKKWCIIIYYFGHYFSYIVVWIFVCSRLSKRVTLTNNTLVLRCGTNQKERYILLPTCSLIVGMVFFYPMISSIKIFSWVSWHNARWSLTLSIVHSLRLTPSTARKRHHPLTQHPPEYWLRLSHTPAG